jgi:hypothetical protein
MRCLRCLSLNEKPVTVGRKGRKNISGENAWQPYKFINNVAQFRWVAFKKDCVSTLKTFSWQ